MVKDYSELPIIDYLHIQEVMCSDADNQSKELHIISTLSGVCIDDLLALPVEEYNVYQRGALFLSEVPQVKLPNEFVFGGFVFPTKVSLTTAQYIDLSNANTLIDYLRCFLVPRGFKYNVGYEVDFGLLRTDYALAIIQSFVDGLIASVKPFLQSSLVEEEALKVDQGTELVRGVRRYLGYMQSFRFCRLLPTSLTNRLRNFLTRR